MRLNLLILLSAIVLCFAGCRSKKELDLIQPGEMRAWQTVETETLRERAMERPLVLLETTAGPITIELFEETAPLSVDNFLQYVNDGFYDGTIFHRVEPGMVIQGGGLTASMEPKETRRPILNEADNGLRNLRGTVGAARTSDPDSAVSQFYINLVDNPGFNRSGGNPGYAVFGRVYEGMEIVDAIALEETTTRAGMAHVPEEPVIILSARQTR